MKWSLHKREYSVGCHPFRLIAAIHFRLWSTSAGILKKPFSLHLSFLFVQHGAQQVRHFLAELLFGVSHGILVLYLTSKMATGSINENCYGNVRRARMLRKRSIAFLSRWREYCEVVYVRKEAYTGIQLSAKRCVNFYCNEWNVRFGLKLLDMIVDSSSKGYICVSRLNAITVSMLICKIIIHTQKKHHLVPFFSLGLQTIIPPPGCAHVRQLLDSQEKCKETIFNVERYLGWGCILNCFMLSSQQCFYA